jgi:hypothetical protein
MDIRDILKSFDNLSEGDSTVHKAGPGGYGNKHGSEDVTDQYGKPIGRMSLGKLGAQNEPKRGKGRPPNPDKAQSYDSSALSKAMGMGKAPKPTGKPSVKHSLKEYFNELDDALNEAGLAVQPMPATPQQKQQQAVASKPSFMIKDPANPNTPAITTSDPAVVNAAKNGTMTMQKPGAAPTAPGATPATGAGSQVAPMEEGGDVGKHNNGNTGFDALVRKLTPKYGKEAATKIAGAQFQKMKESEIEEAAKYRDPKYKDQLYTQEPPDHTYGPDMDDDYYNPKPNDYAGRKSPMHSGTGDPLEKWHRMSAKNSINTQGKRAGLPSRDQITSLKQSIKNVHGQHARPNLPEAEQPQHFAQSSPLSTANRGVLEGKKGVNPFTKKDDKDEKKGAAPKKGVNPFAKKDDKDEKKGAAPKKGVNPFAKKEVKEAAKPDFLDLDKDGNKKEPMKQAAKEKKKVKEGMEHHLQAARLEGKSHALRKMPYNCTHDNMEEARCYHEGFKEGLDECYGQMPILGRTAVDEMGSEVGTMASYGATGLGEMDKTSYMKQQAIKTPGDTFKAFGQTMHDSDVLDEFAFEAFDNQLSALLESEEKVSEGMTVSISKGQQGSPDSVSVSAQDGEADQLLSIIKSAGLGLFGGEEKGFNAPEGSAGAHGGINVVDDHDGMMALMKRLSGNEMATDDDYESEEGHGEEGHMHGEEEPCNECGYMESKCQCDGDKEVVDEVESEDQMAYKVAEDNPPDNGSANSTNATIGNAAANASLAKADAGEEEVDESEEEHECKHCHSDPCKCDDEKVDEAEDEKEDDEKDFFHNPNVPADKQLKAPPKEVNVAESFANLYKKLAYLSEESTEKEDEKAEKAGKKVAKDIEYDEGHKGKDDDKAEEAGKKVKKDIEYDDKKDKKVDESYANSADDTFEADIEYMTKIISGGLNGQKSTGQTTVPVIAGQGKRTGIDGKKDIKESMLNESVNDWKRLAGISK